MAATGKDDTKDAAKKQSGAGFLIAMVLGTCVALGSGWFLGLQFVSPGKPANPDAEDVASASTDGKPSSQDETTAEKSVSNVSVLEPIIVILRNSDNTFLRLELAVVLGPGSAFLTTEEKLMLKSEISAYSRTLSLRQISGPSGYLHFREDLLDRVRLATKSDIEDVLVLAMVAE